MRERSAEFDYPLDVVAVAGDVVEIRPAELDCGSRVQEQTVHVGSGAGGRGGDAGARAAVRSGPRRESGLRGGSQVAQPRRRHWNHPRHRRFGRLRLCLRPSATRWGRPTASGVRARTKRTGCSPAMPDERDAGSVSVDRKGQIIDSPMGLVNVGSLSCQHVYNTIPREVARQFQRRSERFRAVRDQKTAMREQSGREYDMAF